MAKEKAVHNITIMYCPSFSLSVRSQFSGNVLISTNIIPAAISTYFFSLAVFYNKFSDFFQKSFVRDLGSFTKPACFLNATVLALYLIFTSTDTIFVIRAIPTYNIRLNF